jgi:ribokinase
VGNVWIVGSLNVDSIVRVERHPSPGETVLGGPVETRFGGKGANQAAAAARAGAAVRMIGRVGDDDEGHRYLEHLGRFGVDVSGIRVDRAATGRAAIAVEAAGENTIIVSPGANASVGMDDLAALDAVLPGDVLLLQLEVDPAVVAEAARRGFRQGARVVLNLAPFAIVPDDLLDLADPVVANETEAAALAALGRAPRQLLVTRGAAGSTWGDLTEPAAPVDRVVDTTGAGDTYCGALAAALARGEGPAAAMRSAAEAAAESIAWLGAQPEPTYVAG